MVPAAVYVYCGACDWYLGGIRKKKPYLSWHGMAWVVLCVVVLKKGECEKDRGNVIHIDNDESRR